MAAVGERGSIGVEAGLEPDDCSVDQSGASGISNWEGKSSFSMSQANVCVSSTGTCVYQARIIPASMR